MEQVGLISIICSPADHCFSFPSPGERKTLLKGFQKALACVLDRVGYFFFFILMLTNSEGLIGNVMLQGSLDCSDHETVESEIFRAVRRVHRKLTVLDFQRAGFRLFRNLLSKFHGIKLQRGGG